MFFTPLPDELKFVNDEGLRSEHEGTPWILIAVPALFEQLSPSWVTIETAEIQKCLAAGRRSTTVDALRLSAHSRGHRGLEHTLGLKGSPPTIDLKLVERVTVPHSTGIAKDLSSVSCSSCSSASQDGLVQSTTLRFSHTSLTAGRRWRGSAGCPKIWRQRI